MSFQCRRCGLCCRGLLHWDGGRLRGLTLLPGETGVFPPAMVRPYLGLGLEPSHPGFKVIAHQLKAQDCPHLKGNSCRVYENRPSACRQFPFNLDPGPGGEMLLGVDLNCPAAQELTREDLEGSRVPGLESASRLYRVKREARENEDQLWVYDLESESWSRWTRER